MDIKKISLLVCVAFCLTLVRAAQISEADLLGLSKQEIDNDSERLFEYVKTTADGVRLGCKGKVRKGDTGKVQALFIEDQTGRREIRKLAPVKARVRNQESQEEEDKYVPLRDFPMYCLERVFTSSTCPPGPAGKQGREGRNGTVGIPGGPGIPGKKGIPGRNGNPGVQGPPGLRGPPGERGDIGDNGSPGCPGPMGPEGLRGTDAIDGEPGTPGPIGVPGLPGNPGTPGINGIDGTDGTEGLPGPDGLPGTPGPDGLPGIPGLAGNNGFNGANGLDGQNGLEGQEGIPGKCCGTGPGGWSSESGNCPIDLGGVEDGEMENDEGDATKTEPKPPSTSFWANDMFSSMNPNSYFNRKNIQHNKNKHRKSQNDDGDDRIGSSKGPIEVSNEQSSSADVKVEKNNNNIVSEKK